MTPEAIRRCLPHAAASTVSLNIRGDHDLNPDMPPPAILREAAVLVPLIERPEGITILLTQRTAHLAAHPGQISFPGGALEPDDSGPEAAALRETTEETGLPPQHIMLLGRLDTYITRTGFRVTPVVGWVRPPFILQADPYEVAELFEVPLRFILDPANPQTQTYETPQGARHFYVFPYENRFIWGATAGMLVNLRQVLAKLQ